MPSVSLDYYSDVNPDTLIRIITEHHLAGLVLLVRTMPDDVWFEKTTKLLETTSANLIVIQRELPIFSDKPPEQPSQTVTTIREIQRGSLLLQPSEQSWQVNVQPYDLWTPGTDIPSAKPQLIVLGGPAALARELAATNAALLSATNAVPAVTNSVKAATSPAKTGTNAVPVATNAVPVATNAVKATTNAVTSAKADEKKKEDEK